MALAQVSASFSVSIRDVCAFSSLKSSPSRRFPRSNFVPRGTSFASGSPLLIRRSYARQPACKAMPVSIRCEQSTQGGNSLDVWLGRAAMVGFAVAITVEIATGKGLLEFGDQIQVPCDMYTISRAISGAYKLKNFGLTAPLPTVALGVTALVGVLTAIFIFQSASKN